MQALTYIVDAYAVLIKGIGVSSKLQRHTQKVVEGDPTGTGRVCGRIGHSRVVGTDQEREMLSGDGGKE